MPAKLSDVAKRAGVSTATVSRVLSGKPHVTEAVRQRVAQAVHELSFRPSRVARTLRSQRAQVIGLIISDIENPFFTSLVRAIEDIAHQHHLSLILCNSDEDAAKETHYVDLMLSENVAGVIISPTAQAATSCRRLIELGIPVVAVDRRTLHQLVDTVSIDCVTAARQVVEHLIADGHRRIGAIFGPIDASTALDRRAGYEQAIQQHQLGECAEWVRVGPPTVQYGYEMVSELLSLPAPPSALFLGNNLLTIGALRAIHERKLRIPDQVAVAAFDEMDWAFVMNPALTVVSQPVYAMGKAAAELLLSRLQDNSLPVRDISLQPTLKIRQSCGHHE